jgi:hypothetical protein
LVIEGVGNLRVITGKRIIGQIYIPLVPTDVVRCACRQIGKVNQALFIKTFIVPTEVGDNMVELKTFCAVLLIPLIFTVYVTVRDPDWIIEGTRNAWLGALLTKPVPGDEIEKVPTLL